MDDISHVCTTPTKVLNALKKWCFLMIIIFSFCINWDLLIGYIFARDWKNTLIVQQTDHLGRLMERLTLASRVPLFLVGHLGTNQPEVSNFWL